MRYILFVLALVFFLSLIAKADDAVSVVPTIESISEDFTVPDNEGIVIINSDGGHVAVAIDAAPKLYQVTCIVQRAASAALQVLLPACKERFYLPDASLQFHGAVVVGSGQLSEWVARDILTALSHANTFFVNFMLSSGFPMPAASIRTGLKNETLFEGKDLGLLSPWIRPVSLCLTCPQNLDLEPQ